MWSWCRLIQRLSSSWMLNDTGPAVFTIFPPNPGVFCRKFLTWTVSPTLKWRSREVWSWFLFCCDCLCSTCSEMLGNSKSRRVLGSLPVSSSAWVCPMVECGMVRYENSTRTIRDSSVPFFTFLKPCFTSWTTRSAKPIEARWYADDLGWRIPFCLRNSSNSLLVKYFALSEHILSGSPNWANCP